MAWVDGSIFGEAHDQIKRLGGLGFVAAREVGDGLDSGDVGVAGEEGIADEPGYATGVVARSVYGFGCQILPYRDLLTVFNRHDVRRIRDNEGSIMIEREILPSIQKHLSS